jgi:putative transposase
MPKGFRSRDHCVLRVHLHVVFVTKYRHPVIPEAIDSRLETMIRKLCETQKCILLECLR